MRRLALLGLVAACQAAGPRPDTAGAERAETPVWRVRDPGGLAAIEPGTRADDLLDADACQRCHPAEHAEWAVSRHGKAWTNGLFQREYRQGPKVWCVRCHAPTAPQVAQVAAGGGRLADQGVGCAACHVRDGKLVARSRRAGSPHQTVEAADFGSPAFCADCHQFTFPILDGKEAVAMSRHPMQNTVAEFHAGRFAGAADGCRTCHARSPAGHTYPGAHDPAMLARALELSWCRKASSIEIAIANRGAGHRVPTGDVHRHASIKLWRSSAPASMQEIFLGRRYEPDPAGGKRTTWDSSLAPGQRRRYSFDIAALGGEPDEPINIELVYVMTGDETPARHRDPGEPTLSVVAAARRLVGEIAGCDHPDRIEQAR